MAYINFGFRIADFGLEMMSAVVEPYWAHVDLNEVPHMKVPGSIHQLLKTDVYVSETSAMNIEPNWDKGY